jgi:hypothetical protein
MVGLGMAEPPLARALGWYDYPQRGKWQWVQPPHKARK